jgi:HEAT repeat protein
MTRDTEKREPRPRVSICANSLLLILVAVAPACHQNRQAPRQIHGELRGRQLIESWEADRKLESSRFTDVDLQHMVDRLFIEADPKRANFHGLLWAGSRPVPFLIKTLNEPRTWTTVFFHKDCLTGNSPFQRICDLLDNIAPAEAAKPLARYLEHPDPAFRRQAATVLGNIGVSDCLKPVKKALADRDREVRQFAMIGLMNGLERQQRDETFLRGIFPALVPLLKTGVYATEGPPGVLAAIDLAKAAPILESPQYLAAGNPQLHDILTALDRDGVKVRLAIVLPLLTELESLAIKKKAREWDYAAALILYARNPDDRAGSRFQVLTGSPSSTIAAAAARGLEILAGINASEAVSAVFERRGFAAMTKPQRYYHAIEDYRDEVNNGGHSQYFYNSSGDIYETAIEGLRAIGATSKAAILSGSLRAFAMLPPTNNAERRELMEVFRAPEDHIFVGADESFSESEGRPGERLDVLLTMYALKHRSDFAPVSDAPHMGQVSTPSSR